jgi:hypothetical protein
MSWADTRDGGRHHGPFSLFRRITGLSWPDLPAPARMRRVALVAPGDALRDVLVRVAETATVELGPPAGETAAADGAPPDGEAARRLRGSGHPASGAALSATRPDLDALQRAGRYDLLGRRWPRRERPTAARSRPRSGTPPQPTRCGPSRSRRSPPGTGSAPSRTAGSRAWNGRWPT